MMWPVLVRKKLEQPNFRNLKFAGLKVVAFLKWGNLKILNIRNPQWQNFCKFESNLNYFSSYVLYYFSLFFVPPIVIAIQDP